MKKEGRLKIRRLERKKKAFCNRERQLNRGRIRKLIRLAAAVLSTVLVFGAADVHAESFTSAEYQVLGNIIGAVESGGQVYGQKNYSAYAGAHAISAKEVTCTLGWPQYYGNEAEALVKRIYQKDVSAFRKIDSQGLIEAKLNVSWVDTKWDPNDAEKAVLISLISSANGKAAQDEMFTDVVRPMVVDCENTYTKNARAVAMYAEIRHLGGKDPVDRIFKRCAGNYSVDNIMASLKADQADTSNNNQVGDTLYWSRHVKCSEWVKKYIPDTDSSNSSNNSSESNASDSDQSSALYRVYNSHSGEHFYTLSMKEVKHLQSLGWKYEGTAWKVPDKSATPVYRLYNASAGDHFYTSSLKEKNYLVKAGWKDEGIGWYSDTAKHTAVYREFNPNAKTGTHNFTTNTKEHSYLVSLGWKSEGIAWYGA